MKYNHIHVYLGAKINLVHKMPHRGARTPGDHN